MGGATTPAKVETARGAPERRNAVTKARSIGASTRGMSPSTTIAPATSSGSAEMPERSEVFIPLAYSGLCTATQRRSDSSAWTRSLSCPTTTSTGSSPAESAVPAARRTSVPPPSFSNILFVPMRVDWPAARTTPATRSGVMDPPESFAQVTGLAARVDREDLGDDADRHLLGAVRADVDPDGREQLRAGKLQLAQDMFFMTARTEQAEVRERPVGQRAQPVAIVGQGVRLHDGEVPARDAERNAGESVRGPSQDEPERRREALRGQVRGPVVDHRHLESGLQGERRQRAGVVSGAEDEQARRRPQHVHEGGFAAALQHLPAAVPFQERAGA